MIVFRFSFFLYTKLIMSYVIRGFFQWLRNFGNVFFVVSCTQ